MQIGPVSVLTIAFLSVVGFVEGVDFVSPADKPAVEILGVSLSGDSVKYTRKVHATNPIRAAWSGDVVNIATERGVPECEISGRATYGPDEPQTQTFPASEFLGPGCLGALIPGETYEIWASVTPLDGAASQFRSDAFTWPDDARRP